MFKPNHNFCDDISWSKKDSNVSAALISKFSAKTEIQEIHKIENFNLTL